MEQRLDSGALGRVDVREDCGEPLGVEVAQSLRNRVVVDQSRELTLVLAREAPKEDRYVESAQRVQLLGWSQKLQVATLDAGRRRRRVGVGRVGVDEARDERLDVRPRDRSTRKGRRGATWKNPTPIRPLARVDAGDVPRAVAGREVDVCTAHHLHSRDVDKLMIENVAGQGHRALILARHGYGLGRRTQVNAVMLDVNVRDRYRQSSPTSPNHYRRDGRLRVPALPTNHDVVQPSDTPLFRVDHRRSDEVGERDDFAGQYPTRRAMLSPLPAGSRSPRRRSLHRDVSLAKILAIAANLRGLPSASPSGPWSSTRAPVVARRMLRFPKTKPNPFGSRWDQCTVPRASRKGPEKPRHCHSYGEVSARVLKILLELVIRERRVLGGGDRTPSRG